MADDSGGSNVIIPIDEKGNNNSKPQGILDAVSKIQQFYVLESSGRGISKDFLTIKGSLNFFNIGIKTGLTEGLMFIFLTLFFVPILYDPVILHKLLSHIPGRGPVTLKFLIYFISLAPVIMSVGICSYLSKYHTGSITKSAIDSLLWGRILLLVIKLVIVFFLFNIVAGLLTPHAADKISHFLSPHNPAIIYGMVIILHNKLPILAVETAVVFIIAILIPFVSVFMAHTIKKIKIKQNLNRQTKTGFNISDIKKEDNFVTLGMGYKIGHPEKLIELRINNKNRAGHTFCFGSTRIGKTRLIESMIEQDIEQGNSVVLFDPKGDIDITEKIVQCALENNRAEDLFFINPIYPPLSNKIDPLAHYYMPEEIVSHVVSGIKAKEEFFINVAYETTLAVVMALIEKNKEDQQKQIDKGTLRQEDVTPTRMNFNDIRKNISIDKLQDLVTDLSGNQSQRAQETLVTLNQIVKSPQDYFAKVSSSLRTVLTALSTGSAGDIIGTVHANKFIERLTEGKKVILVAQTGSMLTRKTAGTISRVLISMIQSFIGRLYASGKTLENPLAIYMDEAAALMYLGIEEMFSKAGGANVMIHAFTQSISDLEAEIGKPFARKILDNTNTKIFMRVNDPDTAKYVSDYSGKEKRFSSILSLGGGITVREVEEPLVVSDDLTTLQKREFYLFTYEGKFKGLTLNATPVKYHIDLPEINLPDRVTKKQEQGKQSDNTINLSALSQLWMDETKHWAKKWTETYNSFANGVKRKYKLKKLIAKPAIFLALFLLAIPIFSVIYTKIDSHSLLSLHIQLYRLELLQFAKSFHFTFTVEISILALLFAYAVLKFISYTDLPSRSKVLRKILQLTNIFNIFVPGSLNYKKEIINHTDKYIPWLLSQLKKDNDPTSHPAEYAKAEEEKEQASILDKDETATDEQQNELDLIDKLLKEIDISNRSYLNPYIKKFYNEKIKPLEIVMQNNEQKTAIAYLLGLLDKYGDCSSIKGKEFDYVKKKDNTITTYNILSVITLAEHTCDVANNIVPIYEALRQDNTSKEGKLLPSVKAMIYIVALAHDIGKINKIYKHKGDFTAQTLAHPVLSIAVVLKLIKNETMFNIKNIAISNHHNRENPKQPDSLELKALKQADAKAREDELEKYKAEHPERAKEVTNAIKQFQAKKNNKEISDTERTSEPIISWIDEKDIGTILDEIKKSTNIITGTKNFVRAIYIGDGRVYVMPELIADIATEIAEQKGKHDFVEQNKSVAKRNGIALAIKNNLELKEYIGNEIDHEKFSKQYFLYNKKGQKLATGYYIPVLEKAFNFTDNEKAQFKKLKQESTRIVKNIYKIKY